MKQDEIIEMARQAGFVEYELDDGTTNAFDKRYETFAKLVSAKEREEIAAWYSKEGWLLDEDDVAEAIRARGQQ